MRAPLAAQQFEPGQFYRAAELRGERAVVDGTRLAMEGIALTGAWIDKEKGLLSLIVLEMGGSSRLCAALRPGEPVVVMGPTGTPTEIPQGETVLLAGGGLGNAVLFSIAQGAASRGQRSSTSPATRTREDVFKRDDIEARTDQVIWCGRLARPRSRRAGRRIALPRQHRAGDARPTPKASSARRRSR